MAFQWSDKMPTGIRNDYVSPKKKEQKKKSGRPRHKIDWKKVESLIIHGCSGVQIAATLAIHPETLYDRCLKEHKRTYSDYSHEFWQKGNAQLHAKQYQMAMQGDKTLIIWLGKNRLKQTDKIESTIDAKVEVSQKAILESPDNGRRKINDSSK